tara:strand:+ start:1968 stop:2189 length:222 start_codon:yes stop_codon:yes gene_type:complete
MENKTKKEMIELPDGGKLEVEYSDDFLKAIRSGYNLPENQEISSDTIKTFIYDSFKHAVDKGYIEHEEEEQAE